MPLRKFRSLDEMRQAQWVDPSDPEFPEILRFVWNLGFETSGCIPHPRGVFKFRSIEEANAHREALERERIALIEARQKQRKAAGSGAKPEQNGQGSSSGKP